MASQKHFHLFNKCSYNDLSKAELGVLERGITEGRNGKGIIYVFAAGNEYDSGETINMEVSSLVDCHTIPPARVSLMHSSCFNSQGWLNTRYTITVGAVDQVGVHSSYSTTGASALFIRYVHVVASLKTLTWHFILETESLHCLAPMLPLAVPVATTILVHSM